jgi:hypothetical protein
MLSSDQPHEVAAAAAAITRVLNHIGADWHTLADAIAPHTCSEWNKSTVSNGPTWDWLNNLKFCAKNFGRLTEREQDFVASLSESTHWRAPSQKQEAWISDIVQRLRRAA